METEVLQKHIPKTLPTRESIYKGAFFASSKSTKSKWEAAIAACPYLKI